jgi:hypothetical protein
MELVSTRPLAIARAETVLAGGLAAVSSLLVLGLAPPGGDTPAHLYRTDLLRHGVTLWDNLWFAGHYPLASYSLLYYLPAALVGNAAVVAAAAIASAALFAVIAYAEWGDAARWPVRVFAVLAAGPLFTGTYSYALGLAAALAALRLLQVDRPRLALLAAAVTLATSPLAFAFLLLALAAAALARRRLRPAFAAGLAALAAVQLAVLALFPSDGRYPFSRLSLLAVVLTCALGGALAARAPGGRVLAAFFAVWGLVCLAAYAIPTPLGDNLTRLRELVIPLVLLAAVLTRFRPRTLVVAALAVSVVYNISPDATAVPKRARDSATAQESYWTPALDFLRVHLDPAHRVEVVPTFGHWEAWWVPRAGFPLARGWYRQLDVVQNPELYEQPLRPEAYRRWLRRMAVRYVLLPSARLGPLGARREADLLRSGRSGLRPVYRGRDWRIYELPRAPGLLTGPAPAALAALTHERVEGRVSAAGSYRLRIRAMPYWKVEDGDVCLERGPGGMTRLVAREPGRFVLAVGSLRDRGGAWCR